MIQGHVTGIYMQKRINNEVVVSEPYQTKVSKEYVISVDDVVRNKGSMVGVISLTISLEKYHGKAK